MFKDCKESARILKTDAFCPVDRTHRTNLFHPEKTKLLLRKLKEADPDLVGVKLWTSFVSREESLNLGGSNHTTAFYSLAQKQCPFTIQIMGQGHFQL